MGGGIYFPSNVDSNAERMSSMYPLTNGYFGEKGKNVRVIKSANPQATSLDFFIRIGSGGITTDLSNGKGKITTLDDGTTIVHRLITSTPGSPAVDIKVINSEMVKSQKIHFTKEEQA